MSNDYGYLKTYQDGVMRKTEIADDKDQLMYSKSEDRYIAISPSSMPQPFNFTGTIRNLAGTKYIRWGQNVDGVADTILVPFESQLIGYSASFNDTTPINTGTTGDWTITLGSVYDTTPENTDCSNQAANFHDIISTVFSRDDLIATNGFPQYFQKGHSTVLPRGARLSMKSVTTGDLNFNNGDLVVNVYLLANGSDGLHTSFGTTLFG